ncbi:MAG: AmmeMemoRadiSam system radical SAM enzyme [Deltaproteobacteria bacterium]|nr:AmmeMemoRadiSam system radical SAM enzyme [Deltaproteobacteria bacterium]
MKRNSFKELGFSYPLTRREVIRAGLACACILSPVDLFAKNLLTGEKNIKKIIPNDAPEELWKWSKEVYFGRALKNGSVQCLTCPNRCILPPNARSRCKSHVNIAGKLYTLVYGNPCAIHIDPVEKKPLYHFLPATSAFSIATTGCSFHCLNCQNWEISQVRPEEVRFHDMFPPAVVESAATRNCRSIAYTYSEATTFYEYMIDTSRIANERGIRNIWVTNGYINETPLLELTKSIDAANVDIKSFSEDLYSRLNAGRLKPVLNTLIVPTYADDMEMIKRMCHWIVENLGPDYPLHFSRFFPLYKLTHLPPTPISFLEEARAEAMKTGLHYVYVGNIPPSDSSNTYCPSCGKKIVDRRGYRINEIKIGDGKCLYCNHTIAGVWS